MEGAETLDRHYTKEEYFELLCTSLHKYEYLDGRVRMIAGGTEAHTDIMDNTFFALRARSKKYKVRSSETAVAVGELNRYYFPDVSAVCDERTEKKSETGIFRITNPALLMEVVSDSSYPGDRTEKFSAYRRLASFREYLLIDSRQYSAETFYREQPDLWRIGDYFESEQEVELRTFGINVALKEFYAGVELPLP